VVHESLPVVSEVVRPNISCPQIEQREYMGVSAELNPGKRPFGLNYCCLADVLVAADHDEHGRNDGKNCFGVEVWFHAQNFTSPARPSRIGPFVRR